MFRAMLSLCALVGLGGAVSADTVADPAIVSMRVNVIKKLSDTKARIEFVCVVENLGNKTFKSTGKQWVRLYEWRPFADKGKAIFEREFTSLKAGQTITCLHTMDWTVFSPGVGILQLDYVFRIDYGPGVSGDANLTNNGKKLTNIDVNKKVEDFLKRAAAAAPLTLAYPNGGETITAGEFIEVRWHDRGQGRGRNHLFLGAEGDRRKNQRQDLPRACHEDCLAQPG